MSRFLERPFPESIRTETGPPGPALLRNNVYKLYGARQGRLATRKQKARAKFTRYVLHESEEETNTGPGLLEVACRWWSKKPCSKKGPPTPTSNGIAITAGAT